MAESHGNPYNDLSWQSTLSVTPELDASVDGLSLHAPALIPSPHVQLRKTENRRRLDRSHRRGNGRNLSYLVDASDVRTVNGVVGPVMYVHNIWQLYIALEFTYTVDPALA